MGHSQIIIPNEGTDYVQTELNTDTVERLNPPNYLKIYIHDSVPKTVNGKPYTGIDTTNFVYGGEKLVAYEIYKDGFKVGLKTFYDNGNPCEYYEFKNGLENGISKGWYKNGQLKYEHPMKDGGYTATRMGYYENGNLKYMADQKSGFSINFYENGKTESLKKQLDAKKCGNNAGYEETEWYPDGDLKLKITSNCGKQLFTIYHNDTTILSQETIIDMALFHVGEITKWNKDGTKMMEGQYKDGNTREEANIKIGVWKYYNELGKLEKEEVYENNVLKNVKNYIKEKPKPKTIIQPLNNN